MTEVQVALAAFDAELSKQLGCLIPAPGSHQHDLVKEHHRGVTKVQEVIEYYVKKLPPYAFVPLLLRVGAELSNRQEYDLAIRSCYGRVLDLNLPAAPALSKLNDLDRLSLHVQASYGLLFNEAARALQCDPRLRHANTHQACLAALDGIRDACTRVMPHTSLYWLVFNGTVLLHEVGQPLTSAGFHQEALPYYVYAAQALESHLQLSSRQYLEWRVRIYAAAAYCYYALIKCDGVQRPASPTVAIASGKTTLGGKAIGTVDNEVVNPLISQAQQFLEEGLLQLQGIVDAQALDPVPPAAAMTAAMKAARAQLLALKFLFEPADKLQPATTRDQLLQTLQPLEFAPAKLSVVLQLLSAGANNDQQPLQQLQLPANLQPALDAAMELAKPLADLAAAAGGCFDSTDELAELRHRVDAVIPEHLHLALLCMAYQYKQQDWLRSLLAAAHARQPNPATKQSHDKDSLRAAIALIESLSALQQDQGDASILGVATCLREYSCSLAASVPRLLAAAATQLHTAAGQLLQGCFSVEDGQSGTVFHVLEGLHRALECCGCDDGLLFGTVEIRLALLLERKGELDQARVVIQQAVSMISSARCAALTQLAGAPDEHLRWITGSCTQPQDNIAALVAGMTPSEQELACIHADALLIQQRLELAAGLKEVLAKTAARQEQMILNTIKRDKQSAVYGTRTMKDRRIDDVALQEAGRPPSSAAVRHRQAAPKVCERQLSMACGKNNCQRALLMTQIAMYQDDAVRQAAVLEDACDFLEAAQRDEAELFLRQQPASGSQASRQHCYGLLQPKILCRTPHSMTLTHFPLDIGSGQQPAAFAVYCKPTGAGIALSINSTAMEYPGSGVKVPIGSRVTIDGLQSNETYIFAIAVYDAQGHIIGELGPSTPSILVALPLPIYTCWARILLTAAQLQHWNVAKRAAGILLPRFITSTAVRPVWQEHPMNRHHLQLQQVKSAASPLLRLVVQAMYVYAGNLGSRLQEQLLIGVGTGRGDTADIQDQPAANKLGGTAASRALLLQYNRGQVHDQIALLSTCKKLAVGMQIASLLADEMLVQEGALRLFNLLSPMLQQRDTSPLVHQALANLHLALTAVDDTAPADLAGHSKQRMMAARATAAVSYWLMRVSAPIHPDLAAGAVSVLRGTTLMKSSQSTSLFAQLNCALLKALAPTNVLSVASSPEPVSPTAGKRATRTSTIGAAPGKAGKSGKKEQQAAPEVPIVAVAPAKMLTAEAAAAAEQMTELVAAQDFVLLHPDGASWNSPAVSTRLQDAVDLPALILPKLHKPGVLTTCWPILAADSSRTHDRWLPLCVMVMEAAATQHGADLLLAMSTSKAAGLQGYTIGLGLTAESLTAMHMNSSPGLLAAAAAAGELVVDVVQHVRLAARKPQLDWDSDPLWGVKAMDNSLQEQGFVLGAQGTVQEPAAPQFTAEDSEEEKSAALEAWQQGKADLLIKERLRLAAAIFLQGCLPSLMKRRQAILHARQQVKAWSPWLARLHSLLGSLAAEAAAKLVASNQHVPSLATTPGFEEPDDVSASLMISTAGESASEVEADAVISASRRPSVMGSPSRPGSAHRKTLTAGAKAGKDGKQAAGCKGEGSESPQLTELVHQLSVQALQQFSQAANLAARAGPTAWQELFNSCKQLWNVSRYLINNQSSFTLPLPPLTWILSVLPTPKIPLLTADAPQYHHAIMETGDAAGNKIDSTKAKASAPAADKKAGDRPPDKKSTGAAGNPKGAKVGFAMPDESTRQLLLPAVLAPNAATALSTVVDALLAVLHQLRQGVVFCPYTIPLQPLPTAAESSQPVAGAVGSTNTTAGKATRNSPDSARPISGRSAGSGISLGSGAIIVRWHEGGPVDMDHLTRLVLLVLKILIRMQRWHKALDIGCRWLDICEGSADAMLLPVLTIIVQKAGGPGDVTLLAKAHQALLRDKNAAFDALERVRMMVMDRLAPPTILSQQPGSPTKAGRRNNKSLVSKSGGGGGRSSQLLSLSGGLGAEPSGLSIMSSKSKQAITDQMLLTAEYEKVVEQLSKRGEKGHMILALNELGDVNAQFGDWSCAGDAWNGALDALLGPYQVVHSWTTKLSLGPWQQILASYGVHGLLLAGTLLGKLARYIYPCQLNSRLSAARLAAELLPAVFAADIIHPQRAVDCAVYVPVEFIPGVDVFDDPNRCNAPDLMSALETLVNTLLEHDLNLQALPLLALWEHLALHVMHQTTSVLLARIQRVKALSRLGLLAEAATILQGLMLGTNLPGHLMPGPQPVDGSDGGSQGAVTGGNAAHSKGQHASTAASTPAPAGAGLCLDASKGPGHATNAAVLGFVAETALQPSIAAAYGPWVCGQLTLARASWLSAVGGTANCWRVTAPFDMESVASGTSSKSFHGSTVVTASGPSGTGARASTAAAGKDTVTSAVSSGPPAVTVETQLLNKAAGLIQGVVAASCRAAGLMSLPGDFSWLQECGQAASADSKKASSPTKDKGGKAAKAAMAAKLKASKTGGKQSMAGSVSDSVAGVAVEATLEQLLLQRQHYQLVVEGLMSLAHVELLRWRPSQALQLNLASAYAINSARQPSDASAEANTSELSYLSADRPGVCGRISTDDVERCAIRPTHWLACRLQLADILLHLKHYGVCTAVVRKALADSSRVGDGLWAARLQHVQANALSAQGNAAEALNVMREGMSRLHRISLSGSLMLCLQLDCAVLCDQLEARGEVDSLAGSALSVSSMLVEQQGLHEMLEYPELKNIYLSATPAHVSTLLLSALTSMRRRQLATSEKMLREVMMLLGLTRSLPTQHATVSMHLAKVLRLQAALKLPATDLVVHKQLTAIPMNQSTALSATRTAAQPVAPEPVTGAAAATTGALMHGSQLQLQRLQEAARLLMRALQLLVNDGGSHPLLVRRTLLEFSAVSIQIHQLQGTISNDGHQRNGDYWTGVQVEAVADGVKSALAALQAAHVTAGHIRTLYLTPQLLQPVTDSHNSLPGWLVEWLEGQEHLQLTQQQQSATSAAAAAVAAGRPGDIARRAAKKDNQQKPHDDEGTSDQSRVPAAAAAVSDATLGHLAVMHYVQQLTAGEDGLAGLEQRQLASAQSLQVQAALARACPKLSSQCCWTQVPVLTSAANTAAGGISGSTPSTTAATATGMPPAGGVYVQWYRQDCCWQMPGSWRSDGCLPLASTGSCVTPELLHQLPTAPAYVSCLYLINVPAVQPQAVGTASEVQQVQQQAEQQQPGLLMGEVVVNLERLKRLQLQVKSLRRRLEAPGAPSDLFAGGTPSMAELASAKHSIEGMLAGTAEEDMSAAPKELPPHNVVVSAATAPASTPGSTTSSVAGSKTAATAANKSAAGAAASAGKQTAAAPAVPAAGGASDTSKIDWNDVSTWIRLEALLDVEDGLQGIDGGIAVWLGQVLQQQQHHDIRV